MSIGQYTVVQGRPKISKRLGGISVLMQSLGGFGAPPALSPPEGYLTQEDFSFKIIRNYIRNSVVNIPWCGFYFSIISAYVKALSYEVVLRLRRGDFRYTTIVFKEFSY